MFVLSCVCWWPVLKHVQNEWHKQIDAIVEIFTTRNIRKWIQQFRVLSELYGARSICPASCWHRQSRRCSNNCSCPKANVMYPSISVSFSRFCGEINLKSKLTALCLVFLFSGFRYSVQAATIRKNQRDAIELQCTEQWTAESGKRWFPQTYQTHWRNEKGPGLHISKGSEY